MDTSPRPRGDQPGAWHHVMNRGLARRPAFEGRHDIRFFLSLLARRVRAGQIEVHAFVVLSSHFHLLLRSPRGELSEAMMWIESQYVRWFNRRRERDGSLFRGRFTSRKVESDFYWETLIRYIDHNSVAAGLTPRACDYPYSSAWHHYRRKGPRWLARGEIEAFVRAARGEGARGTSAYDAVFGTAPTPGERWLVENGTSREGTDASERDFDDLLAAAPSAVREKLRRRAMLADRVDVGRALVPPHAVLLAVERAREGGLDREIFSQAGRSSSALATMAAGLLRYESALSLDEVASRLRIGRTAAAARAARHRDLLRSDDAYGLLAGRIAGDALRSCVGRR